MTRSSTEHYSYGTGIELSVLQLLRLKGRATAAGVAETLTLPEDAAVTALAEATNEGFCAEAGPSFRLTPEGKHRLTDLLDAERAEIDHARLTELYDEFDSANTELKSITTAWQMRDEQTPNDHADVEYDKAVIDRLATLNHNFAELLGRIIEVVPRLAHYPARFDTAIARARAGDQKFVTSPIADSYHQVWFELHEELIELLGKTRAEEAAAGRAV
ncbi:hypothetical protein SAMN06265360_13119 [Haloechinothrix alba]|uniref:Uncharacterized protein n=1 Tax=Haloechinothrix alba TaxID=664784 RepID=A0A239A7N4_9PSEU|nr:hypothetical protein [Haloechinothrix alba]SNR91064.1 hypothetical protein SAMN06265360_13119 [Haloechinothrix alba]